MWHCRSLRPAPIPLSFYQVVEEPSTALALPTGASGSDTVKAVATGASGIDVAAHSLTAGTYYFAYCGQVSHPCEAMIICLKGCDMLVMLGDRDITTEHILQVIEEAHNVLDNKLCEGINEVQLRVSKSTRGLTRQLYCEDRRLSLPRGGLHAEAIMLKDVDREVFQVDNESLMPLSRYLCVFHAH